MKVAIVGGSPLTKDMAPFNDEEWEIWVLGNQINTYQGKRITRIFEIHENLSQHGDPERYLNLLASTGKPLVVGNTYCEYGEAFPYEQANELMGAEFLTSSPAYMMAYAILEGATEIGIYGVEMAVDDHEYFKQRPSMYAWIAFAKARGIKVHIPEKSSLFKESYCEGRDWNNEKDLGPFSEQEFAKMEQIHLNKIEELKMQVEAHNGAAQVYRRMKKIARAEASGASQVNLTDSAVVQ